MEPTKNLSDAPLIAEGLFSFKIGGSERVGADLAIEFAARGYRVVCFAFYGTDGPIRTELESRGIQCIDLDYTTRNRYSRRLTYQIEFYRFLRNNKVQALHVHHATALVLCGIPARLAQVNRVVMTEHALHQLIERPRYRASATRYCRYADAITGVHGGITDYFRDRMSVPEQNLHVLANGVRAGNRNPTRGQGLRKTLGIADDQFTFLFAGRLEAVKDVGTLLRGIALIPPERRAKIRVLIAGDGSQRGELEALHRQLLLEPTVQFLGARTDVPDLLSAADGFIMTSVTEGLPMALIEAMGAEVPCISTAVGGIPELFANNTGLLIPPRQPEEVANTMTRLTGSPELRKELIDHGLAKVRALYNLDTVVTNYLALLGLPSHWNSPASNR